MEHLEVEGEELEICSESFSFLLLSIFSLNFKKFRREALKMKKGKVSCPS